ncbi:alpha-2-macroglobulin family protein [Pedobacter foliorum]|uniref:alpha-2-macroglobulin family protein n=1 Tax=Pedobacter foliorum TaxID=2739058 RepID=UPI0015644008|nr:alpha-2-macroglobulin family protein [Pedobacter foliorum]NRF38902.1 hypothetical protein [Pedobacter foliorum]
MKTALRLALVFACCIFTFTNVFSQQGNLVGYEKTFNKADSLASNQNVKSALFLVNDLNAKARKEGNTVALIKSVIYRILFQHYLDPTNLAKLNADLKQDILVAKQPEKSILQSLLAESYWNYYLQNVYRISQRTSIEAETGNDIQTWSVKKLIDETGNTYMASIAEASLLQNTKIDIFTTLLNGDSTTRYLRPTLYDLLAHRALSTFSNTQIDLVTPPINPISLRANLFTDTKSFIEESLPTGDSTSTKQKAFIIFQNLLKFHSSQKNTAAMVDLDLKRIKFVYQRSIKEGIGTSYFDALQQLLDKAKETEIYSDILYEQALLFRNGFSKNGEEKLNLVNAVKLAEEAIRVYPKSNGAINATNLIKQIKAKSLSIQLKEYAQPNAPMLIEYSYQNVDRTTLRLYKITASLAENTQNFRDTTEYLSFLKTHKEIKSWNVDLPSTADHKNHNIVDKIDGLPIGKYLLITHNENIKDTIPDNLVSNLAIFTVSGMHFSTRFLADHTRQYAVVNSTSGEPLKDVSIQEHQYRYPGEENMLPPLKTDINGFAASNQSLRINWATATLNTDTVNIGVNSYNYGEKTPTKRVVLFTDRPIYRPGQIVYYKGLFLEEFDGKNKILPNEDMEVVFSDVNNEDIKTVNLKTNEYGTFQGSFDIPMGKLNGQMNISTKYGQVEVQVEEYKRPTFQVIFDKPTERYKFNDTITVKGKAMAFSAYTIGGATVKYRVENNGDSISDGTTKTNPDGTFSIKFFATSEEDKSQIINYEINADVTDINGETRSANTTIYAGKKDIRLNLNLPERIFSNNKTDSIRFSINNLNNQPIKSSLKVQWYQLQYPGRLATKSFSFKTPEKYALSKEEFIKNFPNEDYGGDSNPANWKSVKTNGDQNINAELGVGAISLNNNDLKPGYYKALFTAKNSDNDTINIERVIRIFGNSLDTIQTMDEWLVSEKTIINPDESAVFRVAALNARASIYYETNYRGKISEKFWIKGSPKQSIVNIAPNPNYEGTFAVQFTMTQNGVSYSSQQIVTVVNEAKQLEIKFLSFRNKLEPGEKETWKLKISNKAGEKQMAELVATLYDASLDELKPMSWQNIYNDYYTYYSFNWNSGLNKVSRGNDVWFLRRNQYYGGITDRKYEQLNLFGFQFNEYDKSYFNNFVQYVNLKKINADILASEKRIALLKKGNLVYGIVKDDQGLPIPGVQVKISGKRMTSTDKYGIYALNAKPGEVLNFNTPGFFKHSTKITATRRMDVSLREDKKNLEEVVIRGYQKRTREATTGSIMIVSGKEVQDVPVSNVEQLLQGKVAGLNIQSAPKVAGISSKLANIVTRTNFNESAFFYPQLHTNESGEIDIEFTIPQSLTRYKMMGFAHTKDLKTARISRELITQKQLSISANAPRFFREGDTILFSAKLNNLSGKKLKGKAALELSDALTGNIIQIFAANTTATQKFDLKDKGSEAIKWTLIIPRGISALGYKVVAESGKFSDGEEMIIPVLTNSILITETMPLNVRGNTTKTFKMEKLLESGKSTTMRNQALTLEYTSNPAWYAVQALPYLMEYPYECAEQTFSRFYANSFASGIINSSPKIKQVFDQWQLPESDALSSNLEKNPELKSILLEETPWVRNANNEQERKKRLSALFNLARMSNELKSNFEKLQKMQYPNGSFPWFSGMRENRYITQQIVLGMAQLKFLKLTDEQNYPEFNSMLNKAIIYLDGEFTKDYTASQSKTTADYLPLHYLYARSYSKQINTNINFNKALDYYLKNISKEWPKMGIYQQGLSALVLHRNGNHAEALKIVNSLKDRSQQSDEMGMFWSSNTRGWWWYQSPIETQALLIEVFNEVASDIKSVEEMKIWLLKNKQTNDWKTTKATTAACYALLMQGHNLLEETGESKILIGDKSFEQLGIAEPKKEAGTGYQKVSIAGPKVKPEMGKIEITNNNNSIAWGGVYWQYFEQLDKITPSETGVKIKKQLFLKRRTANGDQLAPLNTSIILQTGDLVKVRIEISADRDMEYIHLKDMRSSGFEPVNVISQYKYQDGLGYYESTKDASTNFFMDYMRKGVYVFEYELRVSQAGNFSNGITTLQSMYAPEFSTHSEGIRVTVKPL